MAAVIAPARRAIDALQQAVAESLVRNSLYLMATTVSTAGLGYIYWIAAAHLFDSSKLGITSAVISVCSTISLMTYLGPSAMLIERLPKLEGSSGWAATYYKTSLTTALATSVVTAATIPFLILSHSYQAFFTGAATVVVVVIGAGMATLLNMLASGFISARRSGRQLATQTVVSGMKLLLLFPLAAYGSFGLMVSWVGSAAVGITLCAILLVPGMRVGSQKDKRSRRRIPPAGVRETNTARRSGAARHRRKSAYQDRAYWQAMAGQHLTSAGGMLTPLLLPVVVTVRLGAVENAYFYVTWMVGASFFMVSPSVATAVFAEGVRPGANLNGQIVKALRLICLFLIPSALIAVIAGKYILMLFGQQYAAAGYELIVILAISAFPDAVSNVAVVACRVTRRLTYSVSLNLGILASTLVAAWLLAPRLGIDGAGIAWLLAQSLGAVASLPAFSRRAKTTGSVG